MHFASIGQTSIINTSATLDMGRPGKNVEFADWVSLPWPIEACRPARGLGLSSPALNRWFVTDTYFGWLVPTLFPVAACFVYHPAVCVWGGWGRGAGVARLGLELLPSVTAFVPERWGEATHPGKGLWEQNPCESHPQRWHRTGPAEPPRVCPRSMAVPGPALRSGGRWAGRPHSETNQDLNLYPRNPRRSPDKGRHTPAVTVGRIQKAARGVVAYQRTSRSRHRLAPWRIGVAPLLPLSPFFLFPSLLPVGPLLPKPDLLGLTRSLPSLWVPRSLLPCVCSGSPQPATHLPTFSPNLNLAPPRPLQTPAPHGTCGFSFLGPSPRLIV